MSATRSIGAELMKYTTVRSTWILGLILFLYVAVCAAGFAGVLGVASQDDQSGMIAGLDAAPMIYSLATSIGYVFPVLVGALAISSEMRFQTLTPTFLATPRRGTVLLGKLVSAAVVGAVLGVVALLASVGIGALLLSVFGLDTALDSSDTWALIGRAVLAMVLWSIVGVGLGTLVPNQVAVIIIVIAFTQFVEPTLRVAAGFADWAAQVGRFLPGAASDALVGSSVFTVFMGSSSEALEFWQGGLVLLGIAAVLMLLGSVTTWRRDVT